MKKVAISIVLFLMLAVLSSCTGLEPVGSDGTTEATENRYSELEIREYEGTRLDPSVGPRDNSIAGIQNVELEGYTLKITGLVQEEQSLTYEEILAMPAAEKLITLHCVEGWEATVLWEGVPIGELINLAEADGEANTVIFHCVDGYTTSMPLADILERNMILAYSSNGIPLPPALGFPFIVVAEDKWGYKWARWVDAIILSSDTEYKGYWEERGFGNGADLP